MNIPILDEINLNALDPDQVSLYLQRHGWRVYGKDMIGVVAWEHPALRPTMQIPPNREFADYAEAMTEMLAILEQVEGRPQQAILNDILGIGVDMLRITLSIEASLSLSDLFMLTACLRDIAVSIDTKLPERITFNPPEFDPATPTHWTLTLTAQPDENGLGRLIAALNALSNMLTRHSPSAILSDSRFADRRMVTALHLMLSRVAALKQVTFAYLPSQPDTIKSSSSVVFEAGMLESLLQAMGFSSAIVEPV